MTEECWCAVLGCLSPLITLLAVIVAMFKDEFWRWYRRPKLELDYSRDVGCCSVEEGDRLEFRIVAECENSQAHDAEVFVRELLVKSESGEYSKVTGFVPGNLSWVSNGLPLQTISPGIPKYCLLGDIHRRSRTSAPVDFDTAVQNTVHDATDPHFQFKVGSRPVAVKRGTYKIELCVGAANVLPKHWRVELQFKNAWFHDATKTFREGVEIKLTTG